MLLCLRGALHLLATTTVLTGAAGCDAFAPSEEGADTLRLKTLWFQSQPGDARPQPAISGEMVYTATGSGQVIARDLATGKERWTTRVGNGRLEGANLVSRSGVVVAPVVSHTVGLDAATGRELWRYEAPIDSVGGGPPNPGTVANIRIAADDEAAYVSAWGPSISALELRTGRIRWTWTPEPDTPFRFGAEGVTLEDGVLFGVLWHAMDFYGSHCEM